MMRFIRSLAALLPLALFIGCKPYGPSPAAKALPTDDWADFRGLAPDSLSFLRESFDGVERITWHEHEAAPIHDGTRPTFTLYFGRRSGGLMPLRLYVQASGAACPNLRSIVVRADTSVFRIGTPYQHVKRERTRGSCVERYDAPLGWYNAKAVRALATADSAAVRIVGERGSHDRQFTAREQAVLSEMLAAYLALGGEPGE